MSVSILIVDDEKDVGDLFRRRFRREIRSGDYTLHFAISGQKALDIIAQEVEPELMLILSDINMPGMSGLELLTEVKKILPHLPVVMITAYGDDENRKKAQDFGASEFMTKPIDFDDLKYTISMLVKKKVA
ncbi:MAG: response regulator [Gammaproteobacteria bacterium]|nr:response regulator [Gammaproteobacteria bacterium]